MVPSCICFFVVCCFFIVCWKTVELRRGRRPRWELRNFLYSSSVQTTHFELWMNISRRCMEYFPLYMLKSNEKSQCLAKGSASFLGRENLSIVIFSFIISHIRWAVSRSIINNLPDMTFLKVFSRVCPRKIRVVLLLSLPTFFFIATWFTGKWVR